MHYLFKIFFSTPMHYSDKLSREGRSPRTFLPLRACALGAFSAYWSRTFADEILIKWYRLHCCRGVKLSFTNSSSSEPLSQFQTILAQSIHGWRGFKFFFEWRTNKFSYFFLLLINVMIWAYVSIDWNCFLRWAMWPTGLLLFYA